VDGVDGLPKGVTPIDFFNPDHNEYPLTINFDFVEVTLNKGDCMYIPAYYYM